MPDAVAHFDDPVDNRAWYRIAVTHRALHAAAGTFALSWTSPPSLYEPLVDRLDVPVGTTDLWGFFGLFNDRRLAVDLFCVLEDLRVDALLFGDYPGLRRDLRRAQARWLDRRPPLASLPLRSAMVELVARYSVADWDAAVPAACASLASALGEVVPPLEDRRAGVRDSAEATLRVYSLIRALPQVAIASDQDSEPLVGDIVPPVWSRHWPEPPRPRLEGSQALAVEVPQVDYRDRLVAGMAGRRPTPATGDQGV